MALTRVVGKGLAYRFNQSRALVDQSGIELHQVGARLTFGDRIVARTDATDTDERNFSGQSIAQGSENGG